MSTYSMHVSTLFQSKHPGWPVGAVMADIGFVCLSGVSGTGACFRSMDINVFVLMLFGRDGNSGWFGGEVNAG
jgi:hypothetical protein